MWRDELVRRFPALATLPPSSYVVGGAIRDLLMGREPADADVACLDPLAAARTVSPKVIRLGDQEHLSAYRVVLPEHVYDFAELLDANIADDLARRDFTVNAMAVDLSNGALLDPHGGQQDLRDRVVRMVHAENFDDDPLRTLKGVRMAVKYGMSIDDATIAAIRERAPKLASVAKERVMYELSVIFSSNAFRTALDLLHRTALDEVLGIRAGVFHADDVSFAGCARARGRRSVGLEPRAAARGADAAAADRSSRPHRALRRRRIDRTAASRAPPRPRPRRRARLPRLLDPPAAHRRRDRIGRIAPAARRAQAAVTRARACSRRRIARRGDDERTEDPRARCTLPRYCVSVTRTSPNVVCTFTCPWPAAL